MRKNWLQDAFYFVTLGFSLYNEPRRELIELYLRKKSCITKFRFYLL